MRSWRSVFTMVVIAIVAGPVCTTTAVAQTEFKLTVSDSLTTANDIGRSVSISGNYAILGDIANSEFGGNSGAAYVFKRTGTTWSQQAKFTASDAAEHYWFGWSVSISGDYAIVGAPGNKDLGTDTGAAYVFKRDGTTWSEEAKPNSGDSRKNDHFGWSVAIDGDLVIVGSSA